MLCGKCGRRMIVRKNGVLVRTKEGLVVYADNHVCVSCIVSVYKLANACLSPDQYREEMIDVDFRR